jgi:hypothetical protein
MIHTIGKAFHRFPGLSVFAAVFALTWGTAGQVGVVWDEPFFWDKEEEIGRWAVAVLGTEVQRAAALSADGLKYSWPFCIGIGTPHENPPMWAILGETGHAATSPLVGELHGRRLASAALFSAVAAGLFTTALRAWGPWAAWTALAAWVLHPRVFTHGRIGAIDMTMTAFWFFAASSFRLACDRLAPSWRFGPLLGFAIMSKFTAVVAGPANLVWALVYGRWNVWRVLVFAAILTPITAYAVHPGWWRDPIAGINGAVDDHRHRHQTQVVPTYYWGEIHKHDLPWHNTLVLTFCCTPPAWIALAAIGLLPFLAGLGRDSLMGWAVFNWAAMMIVRALPIAPGHDGIRQFLPAFPFLALMAAFGLASIQRWLGGRNFVGALVFLIAAGLSAFSAWNIRQAPLSYYSEAIGGLPGAQEIGFESTYWWECVTPTFIEEMNRTLPAKAIVGLSSHGDIKGVFDRYRRWGLLRPDVSVLALDQYYSPRRDTFPEVTPTHFLILNREGMLLRKDWPINERFQKLLAGDALATVEVQGVRLAALVESK